MKDHPPPKTPPGILGDCVRESLPVSGTGKVTPDRFGVTGKSIQQKNMGIMCEA